MVDFDVLFVPDSHENIVLIAPQLAFHGATGATLLGTSGWNHPDLVRIGQKHVEGAVFTAGSPVRTAIPSHEEFARRFSATFHRAPDSFAAQAYDAATLVMQQWVEGTESREEMQRALVGLDDQAGASGVFSIDSQGNAVRRPHLLAVEERRITSLGLTSCGSACGQSPQAPQATLAYGSLRAPVGACGLPSHHRDREPSCHGQPVEREPQVTPSLRR